MSFQSFLESSYSKVIETINTDDIAQLPNTLTSLLLEKFQSNEEFNDYKLVINTNLISIDLKGDVKAVTAGLYNKKTDGIVTIREQYNGEYIIVVTLVYVKN